MTPERLKNLIATGETLQIEFKGESRSAFEDPALIEAVVCLTNLQGYDTAWLFIGVEDDGTVTGARKRHNGTTHTARIQALIANRTRPSLTCLVELIELDGKDVIVVEIPTSKMPVGSSDGIYKRRAMGTRGPECPPFHYHEMQSRLSHQGLQDYSTVVLPTADWSSLDPLEFERYRRTIRESREQADRSLLDLSDLELAKALGAVEIGPNNEIMIRILGLLLFGKEEQLSALIPTHEVAFQTLSGTNVLINDFFRWPLIRVMDEMMSRFDAKNGKEELRVGYQRVSLPDYSRWAFREGIANAFVHRDYTRMGAVHIQWHRDRIEVSSPGGFPEGVRLDNLLVTPPRPRNLLLTDAFKRAGIVERTSRGINTIYFEQLRIGRPAPSYDRSSATDVILVTPGGKANLEFVKFCIEEGQADHELDVWTLLILNALWTNCRLTSAQAAKITQRPEVETSALLEKLIDAGFVIADGANEGRLYEISPTLLERLASLPSTPQHRLTVTEQEQTILEFVRKHGRIRRSEAARVCNISSDYASKLLQRMAKKYSEFTLQGERKGAYYTWVD